MLSTTEFFQYLVCPRDHYPLHLQNNQLICEHGHQYPIISGVPILLLDDVPATHAACGDTLKQASNIDHTRTAPPTQNIDPYVQRMIVGTNGQLYTSLINNLTEYPIPQIRLPKTNNNLLLDIGCGWGRWCVSAARKGYTPIGIDPSLEAVLAAQHVAQQCGVTAFFLVADARFLPFSENIFDTVFSYSVLQHFSKTDAQTSLREINRVLKPQGKTLIQLPQVIGLRNLYNIMRNRNSTNIFRVRYWGLNEMRRVFANAIGTTKLSVDGYFGLGVQPSDIHLLPSKYQLVVRTSEFLRKLSLRFPWMIRFADSVYVESTKDFSSTAVKVR